MVTTLLLCLGNFIPDGLVKNKMKFLTNMPIFAVHNIGHESGGLIGRQGCTVCFCLDGAIAGGWLILLAQFTNAFLWFWTDCGPKFATNPPIQILQEEDLALEGVIHDGVQVLAVLCG